MILQFLTEQREIKVEVISNHETVTTFLANTSSLFHTTWFAHTTNYFLSNYTKKSEVAFGRVREHLICLY